MMTWLVFLGAWLALSLPIGVLTGKVLRGPRDDV